MRKIAYASWDLIAEGVTGLYGGEIRIHNTNHWNSDNIILNLGVNWAALGTVSAEEAVAFAEHLKVVAEFADKVNKLDLKIVTGNEAGELGPVVDEETYNELSEQLEEFFSHNPSVDQIIDKILQYSFLI